VDESEQVAADSAGLRRHHALHGVGRNGRVDGGSPAVEHLHPGLRGEHMRRDHRTVISLDFEHASMIAVCGFRLESAQIEQLFDFLSYLSGTLAVWMRSGRSMPWNGTSPS
jgi:hypothetical protein